MVERGGFRMKIFLSAPLSHKINKKTQRVSQTYASQLNELMLVLENPTGKKRENDTYCCFFEEGFGLAVRDPDIAATRDFRGIKTADAVVVYFEGTVSAGIGIELGWASALKKKIILLKKKGVDFPKFVKGLRKLYVIEYGTFSDLHILAEKALHFKRYGRKKWSPALKEKFKEMRGKRVHVVYFDKEVSPDDCVELGWASALRKKIIILKKEGVHLPHLIQGLDILTDVEIIEFKNLEKLLLKLKRRLSRLKVLPPEIEKIVKWQA